MTPLAHLSSGYLVYKLSEINIHELPNKAILGLAMAGAFAPDIDGFFGSKLNSHRYTVFHAPLFWIGLVTLTFLIGRLINSVVIQKGVLVFAVGVFSHLFLDWVSARTCGIMLFYPFSKKPYSLFPLKPEMGNVPTFPEKSHLKFWKFYLENKFLIGAEASILFLGILAILVL